METKTAVVNAYRERPDVYAGRASSAEKVREQWGEMPGLDGILGNPFPVAEHGLVRCLELFWQDFRGRVKKDRAFREFVLSCRGKKLGCFCLRPDGSGLCHARLIAFWLDTHPEAT